MSFHRDPSVHKREAAAANRGHRARAVRLGDLGHDAHRISEFLGCRQNCHERALREPSVTYLATLGRAHATRLAGGVWRHVVMEHEALLVLAHQRVDDLLIAPGPERRHHQCLRFATGKERRAVRARQHAHANADRPNGAGVAAVDTRLAVQDLIAYDSRFELEAYFLHRVRVGPALLAHADLFEDALPDPVYRLGTRLLLAQRERRPQVGFGELPDAAYERRVPSRS